MAGVGHPPLPGAALALETTLHGLTVLVVRVDSDLREEMHDKGHIVMRGRGGMYLGLSQSYSVE